MLRRPLNDTKKIRSKSIYTKRAMKIPLPRSRVSAIGIRRLTREEMAEAGPYQGCWLTTESP